MKAAQQPVGPTRKGDSPRSKKAGAKRGQEPREIAATVKQWAKEKVKKSPVDTAEGGSGQP
jgi:hypothetical protein